MRTVIPFIVFPFVFVATSLVNKRMQPEPKTGKQKKSVKFVAADKMIVR
jgi:hypothetical protein